MEVLREQYEKEVIPALMKKFEYKSVMQVPKLEKIVINIGLGDTKDNPKALDNAIADFKKTHIFSDVTPNLNYYTDAWKSYVGRKGTWHIIILSAYAIWCFLSILLPENKFIQDDKGLPFIIFAFSFAELEGTKTPENDKDISNPLLRYPFLYFACFVSVTALLWYLLSM